MDVEPTMGGTNGEGLELSSKLSETELSSLRIRTENLSVLKKIDSITFVGSSLTGKTTLVDAIRAAQKNVPELAIFSIPKRITTRPQRENDNLDENEFVSHDVFDKMVKQGEIGLHWTRKMEGTRVERYGFLKPPEGSIAIYSANNAIVDSSETVEPTGAMDNSLIIAVYAAESERKERLTSRSHDLVRDNPDEVKHRLSDRAVNTYPNAHIIVKNFGRYIDSARSDVVNLMMVLSKSKG